MKKKNPETQKPLSKYKNTIKSYAKKYNISVIKTDAKGDKQFKNVNTLSNEIYNYEKKNTPHNALYPFFRLVK